MSVERAQSYLASDRVFHVDGDKIIEPFGGYVPTKRLVGAAAVAEAAGRWLDSNSPTSPTSEGTPPSTNRHFDDDILDPLKPNLDDGKERRQALEDDIEDLEALTTKALELAA